VSDALAMRSAGHAAVPVCAGVAHCLAAAERAVADLGRTAVVAGHALAGCSGPAAGVAGHALVACFRPASAVARHAAGAAPSRPSAVAVEHAAGQAWIALACSVAVRDGLSSRPAAPVVRTQEQSFREAKTELLC